ncbi:MAG: putative sodium:solute symporter family protein [Prokaryotic dsDNA virus sp.]|jgi:Na+/proline symporter|nr:MAG: putative sodium:solute symporter family protein [Prokaryotic dsDNA virus sp.]|tara:strand:- start:221 stop:1645 length:1425 start_codon:yes stop_codon:yes gene_type:complete
MIFSEIQGWLFIALYAALAIGIAQTYKIKANTKESYLVADRKLNSTEAGFSIAATWIWAPALFVASQQAYNNGWIGVFYFTVPNILTLVLFAYLGQKVRNKYKKAFTLSSTMEKMHSKRVQKLYIVSLSALSICSFAVQLLAGGAVVESLTGINFTAITIAMALIAVAYSYNAGLGASVRTDYLQMAIIGGVALVLVPWIINVASFDTLKAGLNGFDGMAQNMFTGKGVDIFYGFGISVTIGLLSGSFGDQSFWQRAYATEQDQVKTAFLKGSAIFGVVPILMSVFGFIAAGQKYVPDSNQLVNVEIVLQNLPEWTAIPFLIALLSGLISTLDSCLCSISSLVGEDLTKDNKNVVDNAKKGMAVLVVFGLVVANIPNMEIVYLFLFYGTLRAGTLIPTLLTIIGLEKPEVKPTENSMFYGIIAGLAIGLPLYVIGRFTDVNSSLMWLGTCVTCFLPGVVTYLSSKNGQKIIYYS